MTARTVALTVLALCLPAVARGQTASDIEARFAGHYELVSFESFRPSGEVVDMQYVGRIMYDGRGNMSAIGMPKNLPDRARQSEENVQAGFAYWGTVSFDVPNGIVIHHVQGSPTRGSWPGVDNVRHFEFTDEGLLELSIKNEEGRTTSTLTWRRIAGPAGADPMDDAVTIEYIAHASFIVESPTGTRILLDPYADRVWLGYDFPEGLAYDAVAITHPHYDHDGGEFRGLDTPWPEATPVFRDAGTQRVGDVRLVGVAAKHADPYGKEFGQKNVVWILEVGGLRIAHIGDNGPLTPAVVQGMGSVDVLMLPVDGDEHILTFAAIDRILEQVDPAVVIPMHYRIPELEPGDGPSDLGPIDPWLAGRVGARRLASNVLTIDDVPSRGSGQVIVLAPSPAVSRPEPGGSGTTRLMPFLHFELRR